MKSIFHHFKGVSLRQIKIIFLEDESPTLNAALAKAFSDWEADITPN